MSEILNRMRIARVVTLLDNPCCSCCSSDDAFRDRMQLIRLALDGYSVVDSLAPWDVEQYRKLEEGSRVR